MGEVKTAGPDDAPCSLKNQGQAPGVFQSKKEVVIPLRLIGFEKRGTENKSHPACKQPGQPGMGYGR